MTKVTITYPTPYPTLGEDDVTTREVATSGTPREQAEQILAAWLEWTAIEAELDPEEDDREDWTITSMKRTEAGTVVAVGQPYRGDEVTFEFLPS